MPPAQKASSLYLLKNCNLILCKKLTVSKLDLDHLHGCMRRRSNSKMQSRPRAAYQNDKPTFLNFPRSDASAKAISATRLSAKFLNEACTDKSATGAERYFIILLNSCGWLLRPAGERLRIMQIGMQSQFPRRCSRITAGRVFNGLFYLCAPRAPRRPFSLHACATDSNNNYCASLQVTRNKSRPTASWSSLSLSIGTAQMLKW